MDVMDLFPRGCTVLEHDTVSIVYDGDQRVLALIFGDGNAAERAHVVAGLSSLLMTIDIALRDGRMLPLVTEIEKLELAITPPMLPRA